MISSLIIECTVDSIKDELRKLILSKKKRDQIGKAGWEFAKKHYDRDTANEALWKIYLSLFNK